ncbi:MAG: M23 family metallopeptidase [Treponema sp.]|nr:M23 family metallopeptidase [Treponema sp.]
MKKFTAGLITGTLLFPALFGHLNLSAMDWPMPEAEPVRNFGWNNDGKPVLGTSFEGEGPILAAGGGELIFSRRKEDTASRLPSPLGLWMALDHGDGLISVYSRCGELRNRGEADRIEQSTPIAHTGNSGWSSKEGFYFTLFDRRERRWVNPSMIITPFPDTSPPLFQSVQLRNSEGRIFDPARTRNLGQGRYTVAVAAADTRTAQKDPPLAPHRIVCSVNGTEIGSLSFETLSARDGVLRVYRNGLVPAKQVYAPFPGFEVGEAGFTRGQATLEIIAQDIAGNSRSAVFRLIIE